MSRVIMATAFAVVLLLPFGAIAQQRRAAPGVGVGAATAGSPAPGIERPVGVPSQRTIGQLNNDMSDSRVAHPGDHHDRQSLGDILRSRQPLNFDPRFLPRHREESDAH